VLEQLKPLSDQRLITLAPKAGDGHRSPVNASLMSSRATAHDSGSMRFATPPS
jgi:hypothetical protein